MFTALWLGISTFFKTKVFNAAGLFIGLLVLFIGVFIWSNSNVILSKFGFETTTTLKANLVQETNRADKAVEKLKEVQEEAKKLKEYNDNLNQKLAEFEAKKTEVNNETTVTIVKKKEVNKPIIKKVKTETKVVKNIETQEDVIQVNVKDIDEMSSNNYNAISNAFDSLMLDISQTEKS